VGVVTGHAGLIADGEVLGGDPLRVGPLDRVREERLLLLVIEDPEVTVWADVRRGVVVMLDLAAARPLGGGVHATRTGRGLTRGRLPGILERGGLLLAGVEILQHLVHCVLRHRHLSFIASMMRTGILAALRSPVMYPRQ